MKSNIVTDKIEQMVISVYLVIISNNSIHFLSMFYGPFNPYSTPQMQVEQERKLGLREITWPSSVSMLCNYTWLSQIPTRYPQI